MIRDNYLTSNSLAAGLAAAEVDGAPKLGTNSMAFTLNFVLAKDEVSAAVSPPPPAAVPSSGASSHASGTLLFCWAIVESTEKNGQKKNPEKLVSEADFSLVK